MTSSGHVSAFQPKRAAPTAAATSAAPLATGKGVTSVSSSAASSSSISSATSRIARLPPSLVKTATTVAKKQEVPQAPPAKKVSMSDKACQFGSGAQAAGGSGSVSLLFLEYFLKFAAKF
jgi:hypothetical protein